MARSWGCNIKLIGVVSVVVGLLAPFSVRAEQTGSSGEVAFTKDIAPILQRSCQNCHRPDSVAPMSLITYDEVRPWARAIKSRISMGPRAGVMPPWYIEKDIGIQRYKDDPSLSDEEIAKIAKWVDSGAPRGDPADMPPPLEFADANTWRFEPDLIIKSPEVTVKAIAPDTWARLESVPTELTEDRYVAAVQIREVNDIPAQGAGDTVGGRYVFHHVNYGLNLPGADRMSPSYVGLPTHEVGRNMDVFDPKAGRLMAAGSHVVFNTAHLHANGRDTRAHTEFAFKFHPKGYTPALKELRGTVFNGANMDIRPMEANQELHAHTVLQEHTKITAFEPHLHAPGTRMCLEAIWGTWTQVLTCAGYDHNWVRIYVYEDTAAPLLPKGTILHLVGYMDTSTRNENVTDPRNWQGAGQRSVSNMFLDIGLRVSLTEEQFQQEMAERREKLKLTRNDVVIGCPLCNLTPPPSGTAASP